MTLQNNRAPLLCYSKLCSSFRSHWRIQTWVTAWKRPIWVKIDDFFSRVTSKFDVWPRKTIGHLFYATSSFVHHFIAIGEFKLELKSRNAQSGSNSTIFTAVWPWNLTYDLEQGKSEGFESCDGPIVRKHPIWVKIGDVLSRVTLKFDGWRWKTIGHLSYAVSNFVQHFIAIREFKLELKSRNAQSGSNSTIFSAVWPWNLADDLEQGKSEGFESCDRPIVRKHPIWVKIGDVLSRVTLKFDGWPCKTIGHLFYATPKLCSSFRSHWRIQTWVTAWKRPILVQFDNF